MIGIFDFSNTILQSFMLSYFPYFFLTKERLLSKKEGILRFLLCFIAMFSSVTMLTYKVQTLDFAVIIISISCMIITNVCYNTNFKKAILSYAIAYFCIQMASILATNITWPIVNGILGQTDTARILGVYVPAIIIELIGLFNINKLNIIYKQLSKHKYFFTMTILIVLSFDYIICMSIVKHSWSDTILSNMTILTFFIFIIVNIKYVSGLNSKCQEISQLNEKLIDKNNELKKIKHDYGSQISYLNGLYIMQQHERLGELLKKIISGNEEVDTYIKSMSHSDSMISGIINSIDTGSTHIVIDEEIDLETINISEYNLQKVITNITKNAIRALNKEGLVIIKTYKIFSSTYISIKNNGPKIEEDILDKIFELGFTTKEDLGENHGCGLAIVKEIVEENNGTIHVESNDDYTEFKMIFK